MLNVGTYRGRGWCVLELFASYLSRDKTFPTLLITSKEGNPEWVSTLDTLSLAVGTSDFTCCQRNHIFGDKVVPCDRGITRTILEGMIEAKVQHYFKLEQTMQARFCMCLANWWLRVESTLSESQSESLDSFQASLRVKISNTEWADECGVPILFYAVLQNNVGVVRELLDKESCTESRLNTRLFENGIVEFGIPSKSTILLGAMCCAGVEIVEMLLKKGADAYIEEKNGIDCLMFASTVGRAENVTFWLSRFPDWDVNRGNSLNGATALHVAVFVGRNKMSTMKALLKNNRASLDVLNHGGASILSNAVKSVDANADVVKLLLTQDLKYGLNHRRRAETTKWKLIYGLARGLTKMKLVRSGLIFELASESGSTPIQYAVCRGDVEIVELLLKHGAISSTKNALGRHLLSYVILCSFSESYLLSCAIAPDFTTFNRLFSQNSDTARPSQPSRVRYSEFRGKRVVSNRRAIKRNHPIHLRSLT